MKRMVIILLLVSLCFGCASYKKSGEFRYEIISKTECSIVGYTGTDTDVIIPDKIGNRAVVEIGGVAFEEKILTSVTIPDSVTSIKYHAFASCTLTNVIIPNNVKVIGYRAFYNNRLTNLNIPDSVTEIEKELFANNRLNSVTIGNGVTVIKDNAFSNNQLTSVTIPDSVRSIWYSAFLNNRFNTVNIPVSLWENGNIGNQAFGTSATTTIVFSDGKSIKLPLFNETLPLIWDIRNIEKQIVQDEAFLRNAQAQADILATQAITQRHLLGSEGGVQRYNAYVEQVRETQTRYKKNVEELPGKYEQLNRLLANIL